MSKDAGRRSGNLRKGISEHVRNRIRLLMSRPCLDCQWERRPGFPENILVRCAACNEHRDPTQQETRLARAIYQVIEDEGLRQDAFICRGFHLAHYSEVKALVQAALDGVCHGGSIREAPEPPKEIDPDACPTCHTAEGESIMMPVFDLDKGYGYKTTCPQCNRKLR